MSPYVPTGFFYLFHWLEFELLFWCCFFHEREEQMHSELTKPQQEHEKTSGPKGLKSGLPCSSLWHLSLQSEPPHRGEDAEGICIRQLCKMELGEPYLCTEILLRITQILHLISYWKTLRGQKQL